MVRKAKKKNLKLHPEADFFVKPFILAVDCSFSFRQTNCDTDFFPSLDIINSFVIHLAIEQMRMSTEEKKRIVELRINNERDEGEE